MPEPIVMDGQDCYEVEEFLAERLHRGRRQLFGDVEGFGFVGSYVGAVSEYAAGHGARMAENAGRDGTGVRGGGDDGWIAAIAEMIGSWDRAIFLGRRVK